MASPSEERHYLAHPQLYNCPLNSHIFWYGAQENKRRYGGYVFNPSHQRRTTKGSRFVMHFEGCWHLLQHQQGNLFPYLGEELPDLSQFDLNLPDPSHDYRQAWEAAHVPLIDSDEYHTPASSEYSSSNLEEGDLTDQQIRHSEVPLNEDIIQLSSPRTTFTAPPPAYTMATQTTISTTTTIQAPATSTSTTTMTSTAPSGATSADVLQSLQ